MPRLGAGGEAPGSVVLLGARRNGAEAGPHSVTAQAGARVATATFNVMEMNAFPFITRSVPAGGRITLTFPQGFKLGSAHLGGLRGLPRRLPRLGGPQRAAGGGTHRAKGFVGLRAGDRPRSVCEHLRAVEGIAQEAGLVAAAVRLADQRAAFPSSVVPLPSGVDGSEPERWHR